MLGPIFHNEMLLGGRRRRQHIFRWVLGGWILLSLLLFFYPRYWQEIQDGRAHNGLVPTEASANFAGNFTRWILLHDYLIIIFATPVFTSRPITDHKTRHTLLY